ncbi:beta-D-glucan exohydrolase, isoenzyme ExoII [Hordeum vulgare]|nr:beta-D-glucan exohydrolase, isoenzyme ExoII [Hordeum vulgare]
MFVFRGKSVFNLRKKLARWLEALMDVSNLAMCVEAGTFEVLTQIVVDLPRSRQELHIVVFAGGTPGQMTQIERENATAEAMSKYFIGVVLSGGGSVPSPQASATAWQSMVNEMQKGALSTRLGIPMIYGIDVVHGHNNVYKATIFPHNVGLGATRCVETQDRDAATKATAKTQSKKVAACAKHYVGDGGTFMGNNENDTIIDAHGLMTIHMPVYYNSIIRGVSTVMTSYSSWNRNKMHTNHFLVTDFLKNKLKFRGFVISDWQGIDRITNPQGVNYSYSVEAGVGAGIDMIMVPFAYIELIDDLTYQVKNNIIPMSRINNAVYRILRVKFTMGLFENPYADPSLVRELGKQEHHDLAREAVRKSLVLLKNGKSASTPLLPLPKKAGKILVAGSHANDLGNQC